MTAPGAVAARVVVATCVAPTVRLVPTRAVSVVGLRVAASVTGIGFTTVKAAAAGGGVTGVVTTIRAAHTCSVDKATSTAHTGSSDSGGRAETA